MRRLRRFLRLSVTNQLLLLKAALLLGAMRLALWLLPFHTLRRLLAKASKSTTRLQEMDRSSISRVAWAVEVVGQNMPRVGTCLSQALVMQVLLARRGHRAHVHIGVVRGEEDRLQAHAWL